MEQAWSVLEMFKARAKRPLFNLFYSDISSELLREGLLLSINNQNCFKSSILVQKRCRLKVSLDWPNQFCLDSCCYGIFP